MGGLKDLRDRFPGEGVGQADIFGDEVILEAGVQRLQDAFPGAEIVEEPDDTQGRFEGVGSTAINALEWESHFFPKVEVDSTDAPSGF